MNEFSIMEPNERIASMETNIDNIKEDVKEIKKLLNDQIKSEERRYISMEAKFANKWVEKVVIAVVILAVGVIFSLLKSGIS